MLPGTAMSPFQAHQAADAAQQAPDNSSGVVTPPAQQGKAPLPPPPPPQLPRLSITTGGAGSIDPLQQQQQAVELSALRHSGSFGALSAAMDWDEVSSSDTDEEALLSPPSGDDWPQPSTAAAAGGPASSSQGGAVFEPFEVEEEQHATELKYLRGAYAKKDRECEHLRQIIGELSTSRSRAHKTKADLEEQFTALQKEYFRVVKVSDLARTVSQQAVARSSSLKSELAAAQDQARRSRRRAAAADARAAALTEENNRLRRQLALLEQLRVGSGGDELRQSACAREYLFAASVSLY